MSRFLFAFLSLFILTTATLSLVPTETTQAGLIPCGLSTPDPDVPGGGTERCTLCHLIVGINRIIVYLRNILAAIAIAVIVAMAVIYLSSGGNESRMTYAKGGMIAALIGLCIILLAWVMVNFILTLPIFSNTGLIRTNWDTIECSTASYSTGSLATFTPTPPTGGGGSGVGGGGGGTGSVTLPRDASGAVIIAPTPSPTGMTAVPTPTGIALSWTPVPGATGYEVERCVGLTCTTFGSIGTSNTTSFTDTALTPGLSYSYHVRAITPEGVSTWTNVVGATVPVGPGTTPGTGALCPAPGAIDFLSGKSWVSDFTQPNGLPVHWEVAVNGNNSLTFRVICRMSAIGWGADLSPQITVPIGSLTGSSFSILSPGTQRLTNASGNYCEVSLSGDQTYTPVSVSSMRFQNQTFVTGACQGGGSGGDGGSGDPGGGSGGGSSDPTATVRLPGSCSVGSFVPNVSISTGLNGSLTPGQYGGAVGTGSVNYAGPQVVYVNVPAGRLVSIPFVRAPGESTWVDLASFGGSSIVGQRAQISISTTPGGPAASNCVSQLGVFQPQILTDAAHCNVPVAGYINVATTGSCAGGSVTCIYMVRQVGGVVMTGAGTGSTCSSTGTVSPPTSTTPPPFPWTIQGQTFNSLSAAQAAFPNMGIVINGVVVSSGIVIGNVFGTSGASTPTPPPPPPSAPVVTTISNITFSGSAISLGGIPQSVADPSIPAIQIANTGKPAAYHTQKLSLDFTSNGYFATNMTNAQGGGHFAFIMGQIGDVNTNRSGRGFVVGNASAYYHNGVMTGSTVVPSMLVETFIANGSHMVQGSNSAPQLQDGVTYHVEATVVDRPGQTPTIDFLLYRGGALIQSMHFVDTYNTVAHDGPGLAILHVFSPNPGWSMDFSNISVTWTP